MILFKCVFTEKEFSSLQTTLSADDFCITRLPANDFFYGIIDDRLHASFMDILSGETLERLEYLDEEDIREVLAGRDDYELIGNKDMMKRVLQA